MKRLVYIISVLTALCHAIPAAAVTDKEMEQARVIATQTYLRYANDGSGYLDALHPATMAELEKKLKPKEKENIKAFKAIPVPTGYASWDKQKLVDYWSNTAFSQAGLSPKGKVGKNPARKKLSSMTVAAPAAAATPAAETKPATDTKPATTAATAKEANTPTQKPQSVNTPTQKPAEPKSASHEPSIIAPETAVDSAQAEIDEARMLAEAALDADDPMIKKESSNTWIYVVLLCILVAVVVALVVFASNVMKKNAIAGGDNWAANSDEAKLLARKLKEATNRLEESERKNGQLMKRIDALTAELTKARNRQTAPSQQPPIQGIPRPKPTPAQQVTEVPSATATHSQPAEPAATAYEAHAAAVNPIPAQAPTPAQATPQQPAAQSQAAPHTHLRTIYLGRANAKGIFVRADRTFNPGNSVFRLDTTDGLAGTFKVVSDPSVIEKVTEHPAEMLSMACVGHDLSNVADLQEIITDAAGTAILDEGCWKVLRRAKIHYE